MAVASVELRVWAHDATHHGPLVHLLGVAGEVSRTEFLGEGPEHVDGRQSLTPSTIANRSRASSTVMLRMVGARRPCRRGPRRGGRVSGFRLDGP